MASFEVDGIVGMLDAIDDMEDAMSTSDGYSIGSNVEYAIHQEFGTSYQSGTPHLRPGFDKAVSGFDSRVRGTSDLGAELQTTALLVERETKAYAPVDTGHLRSSYSTVSL